MIMGTGAAYATILQMTAPDGVLLIEKLRAGMLALQLSILGLAIGLVAFTLLGVWLYRLFRAVNENVALVLLVLVGVHAAVSLAAIAPLMDALTLVRGSVLVDQVAGQVVLRVMNFHDLWRVGLIFSGLWLIPLGWLVYRCGFLPRIVGMALIVGSVFYVMTFAGWVIDQNYDQSLIGRVIGIGSGFPAVVGEMAACISLLVAGFRRGSQAIA
jgi:hypothetical protein